MTGTGKLDVGKALEKLRGTDTARSKMTRLDEEARKLDEEIQRMRAARRRLERDQSGGSTDQH